jgi:hypothetical protein
LNSWAAFTRSLLALRVKRKICAKHYSATAWLCSLATPNADARQEHFPSYTIPAVSSIADIRWKQPMMLPGTSFRFSASCTEVDFESLRERVLAKHVHDLVEVEVRTLLGLHVAAPLDDQMATDGRE